MEISAYTWFTIAGKKEAIGLVEIPHIASSVKRTSKRAHVGGRCCVISHHFLTGICPIFCHAI